MSLFTHSVTTPLYLGKNYLHSFALPGNPLYEETHDKHAYHGINNTDSH